MPFSLDYQSPPPRVPKSFLKRHPVAVPLVAFILLILGYAGFQSSFEDPLIGVVPVEGIILESESVIKKLRQLEEMPQIKGIIVRINSPGGAVAPAQEIFSELLRLRRKMKVYASIGSMAASGGYYVAVGTERIYANPGSLVGNIGVVMQTINVERLLDKVGVQVESLKAGEYKDIASSFKTMSPAERHLLEAVLLDTHDQFIAAVRDNRPSDRIDRERVMDGRLFTGRQATLNGLVDGIATLHETAEKMRVDLGLSEPVSLYYATARKEGLLSWLNLESLLQLKETFMYSGIFYLSSLKGTR